MRNVLSSLSTALGLAMAVVAPNPRPVGAATRRRWSRRMLAAVAACGLGLLSGIPSLTPAGSGVVQAAQPDQPYAAAPAGGLAGAVPSADHGPTHDVLDSAVVSSGAPDERLDVRAALDQGRRLFSLKARFHAGDYDLAGPAGVSHQPLAEVFAPLAVWLTAPGHEREMVWLWLQTDPRSANPGRFDAACQAFTTALGPYLLKASDLPAGKKWGELTPDELAALRSRPRVAADWSACAGEQLPTAAPKTPAVATTSYDHWMADMSDTLGPLGLQHVVIPGSHDAGTYNFGGAAAPYAQAQDVDITAQLNAGSRYLDIRAAYGDPNDSGDWDFWTVHGPALSLNVRLSQMLQEVGDWANQPGHEKEIILLSVSADPLSGAPDSGSDKLQDICVAFETAAGPRFLWPGSVPGNDILDLLLNDIWNLPGHPTIIVNWSPGGQAIGCPNLSTPMGAFYANQCEADKYLGFVSWPYGYMPGIKTTLSTALPGPYSAEDDDAWPSKLPGNPLPELPDQVVHGLYLLDLQGTPTADCFYGPGWSIFDTAEKNTHTWLLNSYLNNDYFAQQNLNMICGDFVESRGIVDLAIKLNRLMGAAPGARIQAWDDPALYLIDSDGTRRHVPDPQTTLNLFGGTPTIIRHDVDYITVGPDLSSGAYLDTYDDKVYLVSNGEKRWVTSSDVLDQFAFNGSIYTYSLDGVPDGPDLTGTWQVRPGLLLHAPVGPAIYLVDVDGSLRHIPDHSTWTNLYGDSGAPVEPHDLSGLTIGPDLTSGAYLATDGARTYLVEPPTANEQARKRWITSTPVFDQFAFNPSKVQKVDPLVLAAMPCGPDVTGRLGMPTTTCNAPVLNITMYDQLSEMVLYCHRDPRLTSPSTLSLAAQTANAPQPLSIAGSDTTLSLTVPKDYFPDGNYQLTATCATSGTPRFAATPLTLYSSQVPMTLRATPSSGLQLAITCVNPKPNGIHAVAYPAAAGPNSPDAQTFDVPAKQSTVLQGTYIRRANYDVRVDCRLGGEQVHTVRVLANAFPPLLAIRANRTDRWLYCDRDLQLKSPVTLSLAAQTPNAPAPLSKTGLDKTTVLPVQPDYFPFGGYQLTATCLSADTPPFMATPLTLSSSQIPTSKVSAEITGCSAQGSNAYACTLHVTLGAPLAVNTVFSVGIGGGGFANPSGGDRPQVTASLGCQGPPLPSPYYPGNGGYNRYDVNISTGGCTTGAAVTFVEAVTGAAGATITQPVTVPELGASTATFVLPQAATRTGMAVP
jgi:hypothetical protein